MSGHLDDNLREPLSPGDPGYRPPGPPDPPYIEGDLGAPSREEFDRRRVARGMSMEGIAEVLLRRWRQTMIVERLSVWNTLDAAGPILHARLIDHATMQPERDIRARLVASAESDAAAIASLLGKAYAEGLRDGYTQGVLDAASPDNPETGDTT